MFVAEKQGVVHVVNADGTIQQLLDISAHVQGYGDRGLLGMAADSDFANNHWLYLLYVYEPTPEPSGPARTSRLTRVTVGDDNTASAETVILGSVSTPCPAPSNTVDCIPSDRDVHAIGTVRSAPDGTLWVGSGDASDWSKVDPTALRTYDEESFSGKIIHVDRNGMGLPGHAFCPEDDDLTHVCTKLYAKGLRNPFRFTLREGTGPVVGDVGWELREEIDLMSAPGRNYGWPCYEAAARTSGYRDLPECPAEYAREGSADAAVPPAYDYLHDESTNWQGAVVAGPTYTGGPYPGEYTGDIFFGDYTGGYIKRLKLDAHGQVTDVVPFADGAVPVDIELGPGNEIYYVDLGWGTPGTGSVKRVVYTPENGTPVPGPTASPTEGPSPLTVHFSGAASTDPDHDALTYEWDFADGTAHSTERDPVHVYADTGEFDARLTVTDDAGCERKRDRAHLGRQHRTGRHDRLTRRWVGFPGRGGDRAAGHRPGRGGRSAGGRFAPVARVAHPQDACPRSDRAHRGADELHRGRGPRCRFPLPRDPDSDGLGRPCRDPDHRDLSAGREPRPGELAPGRTAFLRRHHCRGSARQALGGGIRLLDRGGAVVRLQRHHLRVRGLVGRRCARSRHHDPLARRHAHRSL